MALFSSKKTRKCPEVGCTVNVNQREADCRAQHECGNPNCPLSGEFNGDPIDFRLAESRINRS